MQYERPDKSETSLMMFLLLSLFIVYFSYRLSALLKLFLYPEQVGVIFLGTESFPQFIIYNILPLVLIIFSYIFSTKLIIRKYNLEPLNDEYADISKNISVFLKSVLSSDPIPNFLLYKSSYPNSFTFGKNRKNANIVLTTGLIKNFNQEEVQSVVLHEYGHVVNGDIGFVTWMEVFINILKYYILFLGLYQGYLLIKYVFYEKSFETAFAFTLNSFYWFVINVLIVGVIPYLLFNLISRSREYLADAYACKMLGASNLLESTLSNITRHVIFSTYGFKGPDRLLIALPRPSERTNKAIRYLTAKHPRLDYRIAAMKGVQTKRESAELNIETMVWVGLISSLMTIMMGEALFEWVLSSLNIVHFPEFGIPPIPLPPEEWAELFGPWLYFIRYFVVLFPFVFVIIFNIIFYRSLFMKNRMAFLKNLFVSFSIALPILLTYALVSQGRLFNLNPRNVSLLPDPFSELLSIKYVILFCMIIFIGFLIIFQQEYMKTRK